jgi:hypothetical protein
MLYVEKELKNHEEKNKAEEVRRGNRAEHGGTFYFISARPPATPWLWHKQMRSLWSTFRPSSTWE